MPDAPGEVSPTRPGLRAAWQRIVGKSPSKKEVSFASFVGLGTADVVGLSHEVTRLSQTVGVLGVGGALGLIATSLHDLKSSKPMAEKWDAASNLAWGQQGLVKLSSSSLALKTAIGLGVVGGLIQTGVGVVRIRHGYKVGDNASIKLGALDVGSGLLWLGWDLLALEAPLFIGSYVLVRVSREAYANRESVGQFAQRARGRAGRAYDVCAAGVETMASETARDVERGLLLLMDASVVPIVEGFKAGFRDGGARTAPDSPLEETLALGPKAAARARRRPRLPSLRESGAG
jgi:hypothetical protein